RGLVRDSRAQRAAKPGEGADGGENAREDQRGGRDPDHRNQPDQPAMVVQRRGQSVEHDRVRGEEEGLRGHEPRQAADDEAVLVLHPRADELVVSSVVDPFRLDVARHGQAYFARLRSSFTVEMSSFSLNGFGRNWMSVSGMPR